MTTLGRPVTEPRDRVTTAIRFPADIHEALHEESRERDISVNRLVVAAVSKWLAENDGSLP